MEKLIRGLGTRALGSFVGFARTLLKASFNARKREVVNALIGRTCVHAPARIPVQLVCRALRLYSRFRVVRNRRVTSRR